MVTRLQYRTDPTNLGRSLLLLEQQGLLKLKEGGRPDSNSTGYRRKPEKT